MRPVVSLGRTATAVFASSSPAAATVRAAYGHSRFQALALWGLV
jgi:hypothetical protein